MPLVFSYGTIQDESVQRSIIGRSLTGARDELAGFDLVPVGPYNSVRANAAGSVDGTRYEITDAELAAFDVYEGDEWIRIEAPLASGRTAWVYLSLTAG